MVAPTSRAASNHGNSAIASFLYGQIADEPALNHWRIIAQPCRESKLCVPLGWLHRLVRGMVGADLDVGKERGTRRRRAPLVLQATAAARGLSRSQGEEGCVFLCLLPKDLDLIVRNRGELVGQVEGHLEELCLTGRDGGRNRLR